MDGAEARHGLEVIREGDGHLGLVVGILVHIRSFVVRRSSLCVDAAGDAKSLTEAEM